MQFEVHSFVSNNNIFNFSPIDFSSHHFGTISLHLSKMAQFKNYITKSDNVPLLTVEFVFCSPLICSYPIQQVKKSRPQVRITKYTRVV